MMITRTLQISFLIIACLLALPSRALAQTELRRFIGDQLGDVHGWCVANAGDVNQDGFNDVIVGAPGADPAGMNWAGTAKVYSGLTGTTLFTVHGDASMDFFGFGVEGAGDVNGDGHPDFVVSAHLSDANGVDSGKVSVYSGLDGSLLYALAGGAPGDHLGETIANVGDLNGDGIPELVLGAPRADSNGIDAGSAHVVSGLDGSLIFEFNGSHASSQMGLGVGRAGDVNGDGVPDIIVGAPFESNGTANAGCVRVFSGVDGSTLLTSFFDEDDAQFGFSVAGVGDLTGDGKGDVIIGAPKSKNAKGEVIVLSGANGAELFRFEGENNGVWFGDDVGSPGDMNGDGVPDLIMTAIVDYTNGDAAGAFTVASGADGSIIWVYYGEGGSYTGESVAACGDTNGDGLDDFLVGTRRGDGNHGSAILFSSAECPPPTNYCSAGLNSTGVPATMDWAGFTSVGQNLFGLHARNGPPGKLGFFIYGKGEAHVPLGDGFLCIGTTSGIFRVMPPKSFNSSGTCSVQLDLDNPPSADGQITAGSTWNFQFWYRDPANGGGGFNFTDGLCVIFCP